MRLPRDSVLAKAKETSDLPLVQVVWKDHCSQDSWTSLEYHRDNLSPIQIVSVGWLLANKAKYILIVQNVSSEKQASNVMCILKSCIVKVSPVKVGR